MKLLSLPVDLKRHPFLEDVDWDDVVDTERNAPPFPIPQKVVRSLRLFFNSD